MAQLIDKDDLVAEIKRIQKEEYGDNSMGSDIAWCALDMVLDFLDTQEVKEVDLEEEKDDY